MVWKTFYKVMFWPHQPYPLNPGTPATDVYSSPTPFERLAAKIQTRGISDTTKRTCVLQKIFLGQSAPEDEKCNFPMSSFLT